MGLPEKVKRALACLKPERIILDTEGGISGYVVSKRFRRLESLDRQMMIQNALRDPSAGLTPEELRRVVLLITLTPEEYRVSDVREWAESET
jgi:hypothetical protein